MKITVHDARPVVVPIEEFEKTIGKQIPILVIQKEEGYYAKLNEGFYVQDGIKSAFGMMSELCDTKQQAVRHLLRLLESYELMELSTTFGRTISHGKVPKLSWDGKLD